MTLPLPILIANFPEQGFHPEKIEVAETGLLSHAFKEGHDNEGVIVAGKEQGFHLEHCASLLHVLCPH